jgi:aspartate 1-decarboxylase
MLSAKIHRAKVTHADLEYEGSLTIPPELLEAVDIANYEAVHVWNITNGSRLETYAISGEPGAQTICANGAAAHLINPGDRVIICAFRDVPQNAAASFRPRVVFLNDDNQIIGEGEETPGPKVTQLRASKN